MEKILDLETVHQCNGCAGASTLHPLVGVMDLAQFPWDGNQVKFGFYTILLFKGSCRDYSYGRESCDYSNASMLFFKPGSVFSFKRGCKPKSGSLLAFHSDFLYKVALGRHIQDYTFFDYKQEESLHLSCREEAKVRCLLSEIQQELHHPIDAHTSTILSRHIELMLDYCTRFYERQFITREDRNKTVLTKMERFLNEYIASDKLQTGEMPTIACMAQQLNLSSAYFADLLKFETGHTWYEHFQLKVLEEAKRLLLNPQNSTAQVAHRLGFSNVQRFSLLFKRITGVAPKDYRFSQN